MQEPLPGIEAQYKMAPINRERPETHAAQTSQYRSSAVMVLFCKDKDEQWYLPLIERTAYNGVHSAQISFPGGKQEMTDIDLRHTALRECEEEIGLSKIVPLGELTDLYIPVSGFLVKPVIGICLEKDPVFKPHPREVNRLLPLQLNHLMDETNSKWGEVDLQNGFKKNVPYFALENKMIWGATAMILSELKELMRTIS